MKPGIVVLLSDFGLRDGYAGVLRGVILGIDPDLQVVDLSHEVQPFAVLSAAYILHAAWDYFPEGSVFCAVVDPGVGSTRGTCLAQCQGRVLIGPDNGLVSLLARLRGGLEAYALDPAALPALPAQASATALVNAIALPARASNAIAFAHADNAIAFAHAGSATFHGRDLFAPAAALAASSGPQRVRGPAIEPVLLPEVQPIREGTRLKGRVLHIDRFGNCISSLHATDLQNLDPERLRLRLRAARVRGLKRTYSDVPRGRSLALLGSSGFLELALREGSAAAKFGIRVGDAVILTQH
jgi:S-adenosylmethionine hydrolase